MRFLRSRRQHRGRGTPRSTAIPTRGRVAFPIGWRRVRYGRVGSWPGRQIEAIAGDPVLRPYGAALGLANALAFFNWISQGALGNVFGKTAEALCWPFWESCHEHRFLDAAQI